MEKLEFAALFERCDRLLKSLELRREVLSKMRTLGGEVDAAYAEYGGSFRSEADLARLRDCQSEAQSRIEGLRLAADAVLDEWWSVYRSVGDALMEAAKHDPASMSVVERFRRLPLPGGSDSPIQVLQLRELLRPAQDDPPAAKPSTAVGARGGNGLLTARDVAALLGISDKTVYRLAKGGRIPYVRLQSSLRFRRCDVEQWIESRSFQPKRR